MVLPLLPDQPFAEGDEFTPDLAYLAFNTPIFDGQTQYLGHRGKILTVELSDAAGEIKDRVGILEGGLRVTVSAGLTLAYTSGLYQLPNGTQQSIAGNLVTVPDNTPQGFVWLDQTGTIGVGTVPPVIRVLLAQFTTVSGVVTALTDLRGTGTKAVRPIASSIKVFGGSNPDNKVCTQGEVLDQGLYYFRDFSVPAGVSITVSKWAKIFCSGSVSILGSVVVSQASAGAAPFGTGLQTAIPVGGQTGSGAGAGNGQSYPYAMQPFGSGGSTGYASGNGTGQVDVGGGGNGGGGLWIEASGPVTVGASATISALGSAGTQSNRGSVTNVCLGGAGGGSGGLILLSSLLRVTVSAGAILDVRGGAGANAVANGTNYGAQGGGGGGGGYVVVMAPEFNLTGANILLTGGTAGATIVGSISVGGATGGGYGGNGGAGGFAGTVGKTITRQFVPLGA